MPFPGVCGRVCTHPCELDCERGKVDEPLAIRALKRFVADYELRVGRERATPIEKTKEDKVAIIGSGPAGLACADRRALEEPVRQIVNNTGLEGAVVVQKLKEQEGNNGFNAQTETYEDLMAAGVIDPTKVVRIALENAASVSGLLLTTEAVVAEKPEEDKGGMPPMPPGGGMGGMY